MSIIPVSPIPKNITQRSDQDLKLYNAAIQLEATFLNEMLKSTGFNVAKDEFSGGNGQDNFTSFLQESQAVEMAKSGGIGLAESLYKAMKSRFNE